MGGSTNIPLNQGRSVDDDALGDNDLSQAEFRKEWGIVKEHQIRIVRIAFMQYQHPDLEKTARFMQDFGLVPEKTTDTDIWFRGYGSEPFVYHARKGPREFLGGAWVVETPEDLEKAKQIPGVKVIRSGELDGPGGASIVTIADPEGFPISLVHSQTLRETEEIPEQIVYNGEKHKPRQRQVQRFTPGAAPVHRLGHYGLIVDDFQRQSRWYTTYFNLVPSTLMYMNIPGPDGELQRHDVAMFAHIDRGTEMVDHHSFFMLQHAPDGEKHVHHCSFEIHDFDSQMLGHEWLAKQGYKLAWGIGRHLAGSQIFDYWWDTSGFMVEHYLDGDIVNENTPVNLCDLEAAKGVSWGPEVNEAFVR